MVGTYRRYKILVLKLPVSTVPTVLILRYFIV